MKFAGLAKVSELSVHWNTCEHVTREILLGHGLQPNVEGVAEYPWPLIWRLEGETFVPEWAWTQFKERLLKPSQLSQLDPRHRSNRTWRRLVRAGRIPVIHLSPTVRRLRFAAFEALVGHV